MKNSRQIGSACVPLTVSALVWGMSVAPAAEMTLEERKQSIVLLEQHIEQRQLRVDGIKEDIRTLDSRVEEGISKIVDMVSQIGDSEDSRRRVSQLKGDIVGRLRNSIDVYDTQRNLLREQLRKEVTAIPRETLESDLEIFNDRIEKRIAQIERIAASFPESEELDKYVPTGRTSGFGGRWGRWEDRESEEISEAWKQNRRNEKQTESMQKRLLEGLEESIAHLEQRNDYLKGKLREQNVTEVERALYESDLKRNSEVIEIRRDQIREFTEKKPAEIAELDRKDAHDTELLVRDMVDDLHEDFFSIFRMYSELNRERADLEKLEVNLAARRKWLEENAK